MTKIDDLKKEIDFIKREILLLKTELGLGNFSIEGCLKRRGFQIIQSNPRENLIFPPDTDFETEDLIYRYLKRYSFRIFLRDIIKRKECFKLGDLESFCSRDTVKEYIDILIKCGIVKQIGKREFALVNKNVRSFGDTFEWFVAMIFKKEFGASSAWGVKLKGTITGGDFDVMAYLERYFVYLELKSSPPKHVESYEVEAFLKRISELKPDVAFFLEDTNLRMKDKIVPMFEEEIRKRFKLARKHQISRLAKEMFIVGDRLFIINSKPDISSNIAYCLRYFLGKDSIL